jgi:hypothetical protein
LIDHTDCSTRSEKWLEKNWGAATQLPRLF